MPQIAITWVSSQMTVTHAQTQENMPPVRKNKDIYLKSHNAVYLNYLKHEELEKKIKYELLIYFESQRGQMT